MAEETQSLTMQGTGYTSKQVTVPADVQREQGIAIDDEVEVEIHGVSEFIDKASFTGRQTGGDRVTVPADVVEQLGLVAGDEYEIGFDTPESESDEEVEGIIPDEEVTDDDVEETIEEAESEMDEEEDSPGLGELFG